LSARHAASFGRFRSGRAHDLDIVRQLVDGGINMDRGDAGSNFVEPCKNHLERAHASLKVADLFGGDLKHDVIPFCKFAALPQGQFRVEWDLSTRIRIYEGLEANCIRANT
jgi:hypothetical protein